SENASRGFSDILRLEQNADWDGMGRFPVGELKREHAQLWPVRGDKLVSSDAPQRDSAPTQNASSDDKKEREKRQQRTGDFKVKPQEYRPVLGAFLAAAFCLLSAVLVQIYSYGLWNRQRYVAGTFLWLCGLALGFEGSIGFLLRIDLWSLGW